MLLRIWAIARNTCRETLRDRLLTAALAVVAAVAVAACCLNGGPERAIATIDVCLSAMGAAGALIAIFIGTSLVHKEMDRRTLFVVLAKPVSRQEFLVGKYLGLLGALTLFVAVMAVGLVALMAAVGHLDWRVLAVLAGMLAQLALITSLAFLFSTITSALLAAAYAAGLYLLGQQTLMLKEFADSEVKLHAFNAIVGRAVYYLLPNFEAIDVKNAVLYGTHLPWRAWAFGLGYGVLASAAVVVLASVAWESRELA